MSEVEDSQPASGTGQADLSINKDDNHEDHSSSYHDQNGSQEEQSQGLQNNATVEEVQQEKADFLNIQPQAFDTEEQEPLMNEQVDEEQVKIDNSNLETGNDIKLDELKTEAKLSDPTEVNLAASEQIDLEASVPPASDNEQEVEDVQEVELADDFFYPEDHQERPWPISPIDKRNVQLYHSFGFDTEKRNNLHLLDENRAIFSSGMSYWIMNIQNQEMLCFRSRDGGGIGGIAVHPQGTYYAIAEKGDQPNIYIYESISHKLYRILRQGTEKAYSTICFSGNGELLASVGSAPSYSLILWNWKRERVLLRSKAFSQEIYKVKFSETTEDVLTTQGMGHIKFWKIAETFTGLKLKGEIGKFGQLDLSDVHDSYVFPDGKVLCSTEYGNMLLWEGNLVKCLIFLDDGSETLTPCHEGPINVLFRIDGNIVSAGKDGWIKFWNSNVLDTCESDELGRYFINPEISFQIQSAIEGPANIVAVTAEKKFWLIEDGQGAIYRIDFAESYDKFIVSTLHVTNSGIFTDLTLATPHNCLISTGQDGAIRLWDLAKKQQHYQQKFDSPALCIEMLPYSRQNQGRVGFIGFQDGFLRQFVITTEGFKLITIMKVFAAPLNRLLISPDGSILAIITNSGSIFLVQLSESKLDLLTPYCLLNTSQTINDCEWHPNSEYLLLACENCNLYEIRVPKISECDSSKTYVQDYDSRSWTMKMMIDQKPKPEELKLEYLLKLNKDAPQVDIEWEPAPIKRCSYMDQTGSQILISVDGEYRGRLYIVEFDQVRPVGFLPSPETTTSFLDIPRKEDWILAGNDDGSWQCRGKASIPAWLQIQAHDAFSGPVRKVRASPDFQWIASIAGDGTLAIAILSPQSILKAFNLEGQIENLKNQLKQDKNREGEEIEIDEKLINNQISDLQDKKNQLEYIFVEPQEPISDAFFQDQLAFTPIESISPEAQIPLEDRKLTFEANLKSKASNEEKAQMLKEIAQLQQEYQQLEEQNMSLHPSVRLTPEEMLIDPEYTDILKARVEDNISETRKILEWDYEFAKLKLERLKEKFQDELEIDTFTVKGIKSKAFVKSFKVRRLGFYIQEQLDALHDIVYQNQARESDDISLEDQQKESTAEHSTRADDNQTMLVNGFQRENQELPEVTGAQAERLKFKMETARIRKEMEELELNRPMKDNFEPELQQTIDMAKQELGAFQLKSSPDYVVPETEVMNVSKKRKQIFMLYEFLYNSKMGLNNDLMAMKTEKKNLIETIIEKQERISEINGKLGIQEELFIPTIDYEVECPENYLNVTDEQVEDYMKCKDKEHYTLPAHLRYPKNVAILTNHQSSSVDVFVVMNQENGELSPEDAEFEEELKELRAIEHLKLQTEKEKLNEEIERDIEAFDKKVETCQSERKLLTSEMLLTQMNMISFFQELIILLDMEAQDNVLIAQLESLKDQKTQLTELSDSITKSLKALSIQDVATERESVEFRKKFAESIYPDDEHKRERIFQFYLHKYKQAKAKQLKAKAQDEQDLEDEDGMSDESDEGEFDDGEDIPDIVLIENDSKLREIIDRICELEDRQETSKRERQDLDRQKLATMGKIQNLVKDLNKAVADLRAYQLKKMRRINQLDAAFYLRLDQIQNLIEQADGSVQFPKDLSKSVLIQMEDYENLGRRIKDQVAEQFQLERQRRHLQRKKKHLEALNNEKNYQIEESNKRYEEKHMLKFGDIIDLHVLDAMEPTPQVLELRAKFKKEEMSSLRQVEKAKEQLAIRKSQLLEVKRENTRIIQQITKLGEEQMKLNKKLDSTNRQLFVIFSLISKKEESSDKVKQGDLEREKQNLQDLLRFLISEANQLRAEIGMFK